MHADAIVHEFTRQSEAFNVASVMRSAETLQTLVDTVPDDAVNGAWVEVACGPGLISRGMAGKVRRVIGVDLTAGMLQVGRREAEHLSLANVAFAQGDAMRLPFADGTLDGAVTRFSLHHIPVPGRVVKEMARVVRPGGWLLIADHLGTTDGEAAAWHQEIERLRDPSHWACLTPATLRGFGERARLRLISERIIPFSLEFEEWLTRGTGGKEMRGLIAQLLAERPQGAESFAVRPGVNGEPLLHLKFWLSLWLRAVV